MAIKNEQRKPRVKQLPPTATYQPTFVELVHPTDVEFEKRFEQMLVKENPIPVFTQGTGPIAQRIHRFLNKVDDIVDQTGIPNLIFKVEKRGFDAVSSFFNGKKG